MHIHGSFELAGDIDLPRIARQDARRFWVVSGETEYGTVYLFDYARRSRLDVEEKIMREARREKYTGTVNDRLAALGWRIVEMIATDVS